MKQQSIVKNYIYNLSYQLLLLIVPIVTTPYLSRVLGETNIGIFNFVQSVVSYFVIFGCIGLNLYGQREMAACKDDIVARSRTFFEILTIRFITVSLSIIVYYICVLTLTVQTVYFLIFGIEIFASLFDVSWYFQGVERFRIQTVRNVVVKLVGVACVFLFVKTKEDLWVYVLCYTVTVLIGNVAMIFCLKGDLLRTGITFSGVKRHIIPALVMFIPQIATSVYAYLDKTMIKLLAGYEQVAYYSQADKIIKIVLTVVTAMGIVMLSRISASYSNDNGDQIIEYIRKSLRFLFLLAWPCMFGMMAIARDFVPWFFGEGYDEVAPCLVMLSPIILFIGITNVLGVQYLLPTRQMKSYTLSVVIGMLLNGCLNFLLIPMLGGFGAAVATVAAELAVLVIQFIAVRKTFSPMLIFSGTKNFIGAAVMGGGIYYLTTLLPPTVWATFVEIAAGAVIYAAMLLIMRDGFVLDILKRVLHKQ